VDRIAALIAAKEKYPGTSCIVDCGTAVTIDALDTNGRHMGGVILPGIKSMRKALMSNTKIQTGEADVNFNVLSETTEGAIHTGCISAVVGGIEYVVNKIATNYDEFDQIIFTGGDAELLGSYLSIKMMFDASLVLDGLKAVAQKL
jgi:type III pantothenate kinase